MNSRREPFAGLVVAASLLLAACGSEAAPSAAPATAPASAAAPAAKPASSAPAAAASASAGAAKPAASAAAKPAAAGPTLKFSYSAIIANNVPEWVADAAGIFKQNGLNVELTYIE